MTRDQGPARWLPTLRSGQTETVHNKSTDLTLALPWELESVSVARRFVRSHSSGVPVEQAADAELLVSELVTNAFRYGSPAVTVRVELADPWIRVSVHDGGTGTVEDAPSSVGVHSTHGRGLLIVDHLASSWGVDETAAAPGKTVWFFLGQDAA